jgi:hypothetical protein
MKTHGTVRHAEQVARQSRKSIAGTVFLYIYLFFFIYYESSRFFLICIIRLCRKLPKILVLHLKRFHFEIDQRGKIEFLVEFPIDGA